MPSASQLSLPALFLSRYLYFLTQRPVSASNLHYLHRRIAGLQSLAPVLASADELAARRSATLLRSLTPGNLAEMAHRLQLTLLPLAQSRLPSGYITADRRPPESFVGSCRRILLAFGPAIGIGDEIMCFPLPAWAKRANPVAEITVMTAYEGLWTDVDGVDLAACYSDHRTLLDNLRGRSDLGSFDLAVLVDFENADLYRSVAGHPDVPRYAELSVGGRVLTAVDNDAGWVYRCAVPTGYRENFYDALGHLASLLGLTTASRTPFEESPGPPKRVDGPLTVFVSPFTSKQDPSPRYWSLLLSGLVPARAARSVSFLLDPGPNRSTRRFADDVARSATATSNGSPARFQTIAGADRRGLSLSGVLEALETADVAVCTDSFAAHAAPAKGCTTLVVAPPGLENWRVPHPRSFYFDGRSRVEDVIAGMRQVLGAHGLLRPQQRELPSLDEPERRLLTAAEEVGNLVDHPGEPALDDLLNAHDVFTDAHNDVVVRLATWPAASRALLTDVDYDLRTRRLSAAQGRHDAYRDDLANFVRESWLQWRNTNLSKVLRLAAADVASTAGGAVR